ncbi:hypothetical protein F5148DRAFT_1151617 [Russula earlei]|uniref:Uncharacterized protein n=1 Tax=Russula earlei TaxID=71964 RepID=A0ACC0TZH7_9AGAM|nr:hypothetical protein F5148DRAFT_1151617 [Russula earlei]
MTEGMVVADKMQAGVADEAEGMAKCKMGVIGVMEVVGNAEARTGKANGMAWSRGGAAAEGTVGRTGTVEAGDTADMTEESEAEMVGNKTATERGNMEVRSAFPADVAWVLREDVDCCIKHLLEVVIYSLLLIHVPGVKVIRKSSCNCPGGV